MAEDEVIENYLLEKLKRGIEKQKPNDQPQNLVSKFVSFPSEFIILRNKLKEKTPPPTKRNQDWSTLRRGNLYYLNNLLTEWQTITKKNNSLSINEVYRSYESIKKSLKKMRKELTGEESSARGDLEGSATTSHQQEPTKVYRWSSRHGPRKVHGLEHKAMSMERELVLRNNDAPFKAIGVVGVAGIGKTTLCQTVFGRKKVKDYFCPRIWVCLSTQPREDSDNRKEIVIRILKCLGIENEVIADASKTASDSLRRLVFLLRLQLIGKRYLIVIDDAWIDDTFFENLTESDDTRVEELSYGLPKGYGGSVILSSRSEALAKKMIGEEASLQYMKPLTDENCDEIFKDTVTGHDDDEKEFPQYSIDLKREIRKRCDGLPLAAKLLGLIAREPLPLKEKPATTVISGAGVQENKLELVAGGRGTGDGV